MTDKRLCSIREMTEAGTVHSLLQSHGLHPLPLDTSSHIFVAGADLWYHVEVPEAEMKDGRLILTACGWEKALVGA